MTVGKNDIISGHVFFKANDYMPFNDIGLVQIYDGSFNYITSPWWANVAAVGNYGTTGWQYWEFQAPSAGTYQINPGVANRLDGALSSQIGVDNFQVDPWLIEVTLDIKPGSDTNPVNLKSKGVIPVAILGTADFDVDDVDVSTVTFGPDGASESHGKGHYADVNEDGYTDLVLHFSTQACGLTTDDTSATLGGYATDGTPLTGTDVVSVK